MEDEFLKLRPLQGRWMFHKASGKNVVFLWSFKLVVSSKYLQLEQWHINSLKQYVIYFPYKLGVSGQRKLSVIPTDRECYSGLQLRSVSNNGKNIIFLVPLQEATDTKLLPYDAAEFSKMAQVPCAKCQTLMPLQLLALHCEECQQTTHVSCVFNDFCLFHPFLFYSYHLTVKPG